jgi:hypothetical protein
MTVPLLFNVADQSPHSQLCLPILELAAPDVSDQECETLWDRVNRICDQYVVTQRKAWHSLSFGCGNEM